MSKEDWLALGVLVLAVLIVIGLGILTVVGIINDGRVAAECLSYGYPIGSVTNEFKAYCIKRVDNTDVVVPLEDLRRR